MTGVSIDLAYASRHLKEVPVNYWQLTARERRDLTKLILEAQHGNCAACHQTEIPLRRKRVLYSLELLIRSDKRDFSDKCWESWYTKETFLSMLQNDLKRAYRPVFVVEHDHRNGRVRGVVCQSCNVLIGRREAKLRLHNLSMMTDYLRRTAIAARPDYREPPRRFLELRHIDHDFIEAPNGRCRKCGASIINRVHCKCGNCTERETCACWWHGCHGHHSDDEKELTLEEIEAYEIELDGMSHHRERCPVCNPLLRKEGV